jgi:3-methylcrotonyl-CoA carboxylase alpha subunit
VFARLLIANRGEIACRVLRTAHRLGLRTVAVYSDVDAQALHVRGADEAVAIGPAPARDSYLNGARIIAAARAAGADAIHPGYGFLAENADFAAACAEAGLVFVGPSPAAMRAMGNKTAARALIAGRGLPVVPGYSGPDQSAARFAAEAARIGYPVLLKAAAGGGGKGMRVVQVASELEASLAAARREARAAFGDDELLLEKFVTAARHIEVQVFGDCLGNLYSLHERDCSVQRRYQKVLEEAPAPGLTGDERARIAALGVAVARAVDYVGAGTVELLADGHGNYWFMEMNTRLQVEHPVTEMITGLDLVEWQLRVAAGESLPWTQDGIPCRGHALEARLYAEDPAHGFLPATGTLRALQWPTAGASVRIDTGVQAGDSIGIHYDPLLAKVIVHGDSRAEALDRLRGALAAIHVEGITTNLEFLRAVVAHPEVAAGRVTTDFLARQAGALMAPGGADPSPWGTRSGWRLNAPPAPIRPPEAESATPRTSAAGLAGGSAEIRAPMPGRVVQVAVAEGQAVRRGAPLVVLEAMKMEHALAAPVDGVVTALRCQEGSLVEADDLLATVVAGGPDSR